MNNTLEQSFVKEYGESDKQYRHTAMVNHRGTVVAFAMDDVQRIYYTVLDLSREDKDKGSLDVNYWLENAQELHFPAEIEQVGYGLFTPTQMPVVKKSGEQGSGATALELEATADEISSLSENEIDPFLSTTARLTAKAPFQVFSDNQHIYVFRQSIDRDHENMVHKLNSGAFSGKSDGDYITDSSENPASKIPITHETLLVDRYILAGTELKLQREVRFRRSGNKTTPDSIGDSLGATDMNGNPFYEPTKELDFIKNLSGGRFSVVLLPTQVADVERWQIFAHNSKTQQIDSFNIERSGDGYFHPQGTQLYTSPDEKYTSSVLERKPGKCPFTGRELVPMLAKSGYAEWAIEFNGETSVNLGCPNSLKISGDQTIELWLKPSKLEETQSFIDKLWGFDKAISLNADGQIQYGDEAFSYTMTAGVWVHLAIIRRIVDGGAELSLCVNGNQDQKTLRIDIIANPDEQGISIGQGYVGLIDEIRIWNRALDVGDAAKRIENEIKRIKDHRLVGNEPGLAGYWRFDEGSGTQVKDQVGHQSNDDDATATILIGDRKSALPMDGKPGNYIELPKASEFDIANPDFTLEAWVYAEKSRTYNILGTRGKGSEILLYCGITADGHPEIAFGGKSFRDKTAKLLPETWYHIAFRYTASNQELAIFVNGKLTNRNGTFKWPGEQYFQETDRLVYIGNFFSSRTRQSGFILHGKIDEVRIWNIARDDSAISADSSRRLIGNEDGLAGYYYFENGEAVDRSGNDRHGTLSDRLSSQEPVASYIPSPWTASDAPIGDHPGIRRTSFSFSGRQIHGGLSAQLYYEQEKLSSIDPNAKSVKQNARVLLTAGTTSPDTTLSQDKNYIAAVDFSISREGKPAQVPDIISVPMLSALDSDSDSQNEDESLTKARIAELETDISDLQAEVKNRQSIVHNLEKYISDAPNISLRIIESNLIIEKLRNSLKEYERPRYVTFYEHGNLSGNFLRMKTGEKIPNLKQEYIELKTTSVIHWNDKISDIDWDNELKVECFEHINFNEGKPSGKTWTFPGSDSFGNDKISSIKVSESDELRKNRLYTKNSLDAEERSLQALQNQQLNELPAKREQLRLEKPLLEAQYADLSRKRVSLDSLNRRYILGLDGLKPLSMAQVHTDPDGLTVSSGLLGFAYTDSEPFLFDSALGRMSLYFQGRNDQFFSAYYDVNTQRAEWSLVTTEDNLKLISPTSNPQANKTTVTVTDGIDPEHCTVMIENSDLKWFETWNDVPRAAKSFAQVLNGKAGEKIFLGTLNGSLMGEVNTLELEKSLPRVVPIGSTLILGDQQLTARAKATNSSKEIAIEQQELGIQSGEKVYLLFYDYVNKVQSSQPDYVANNGSFHVVATDTATGSVQNTISDNRTPKIPASGARWIADAPGNALHFAGKPNYLTGKDPSGFRHKGDITMEAWVHPYGFTGDVRLIHFKKEAANDPLELQSYSLGLRAALSPSAAPSALPINGDVRNYVELPKASELGITNPDFTVEAWVYVEKEWNNSQTILGIMGQNSYGALLSCHIQNMHLNMGFRGLKLDATTKKLSPKTWYHIAFRYTASNQEQAIFINGELINTREDGDFLSAAPYFQEVNNPVYIGTWVYPSTRQVLHSLHGKIDEVRIWNIARDDSAISADMLRRLTGDEDGLAGYYYFENGEAVDRSVNGRDGTLSEQLSLQKPVASPLSMTPGYLCFASVDNEITGTKIITKVPTAANSWRHIAAVYNQSYGLEFRDDEAYGDAGNDSMLNITEDLTIEAFVKLDSLGRKHGILSKGITDDGTEGSVPYAFFIDEQGKLVLSFEDEDGNNQTFKSSHKLKAGNFYRVAVARKIGKEKIEKTRKEERTYEENGTTHTKDVDVFESIELKDNQDISFYITGTAVSKASHTKYGGRKPRGNNGTLYLGCSYISEAHTFSSNEQEVNTTKGVMPKFKGAISEIRIWNTALNEDEVNRDLTGMESGLTAWWRFEEKEGNIGYDSKGGNHARLRKTKWIKNPDPNSSKFTIYQDGQPVATSRLDNVPSQGDIQFTIGANKTGGNYQESFQGDLEEIRIWKTARRQEEILDNLFTRLKGEKEHLIANYTFDEVITTEVEDLGLKSNTLVMPTDENRQPTQILSTAPISNDIAQVRPARAGIKTNFHDRITGRPAVVEYGDAQHLDDGRVVGVYKRCYSYTQDGKWMLLTGYKVGKLVTEWISQVQFEPQIIGYIEGAPPVPSENLTEGVSSTFNGTSQVTLKESDNVNYTVSSSQKKGFSSGFALEAEVGVKFDPNVVSAPMGAGYTFKVPGVGFKWSTKRKVSIEANGSWSNGESFSSGRNISRKMSAAISGHWDGESDRSKWANPELTRRFIPANMGFAFVESETADLYALRLEHNGALVAFRMLPNPDIPKDTNIIPFPINPRYTKQGTLDGKIGEGAYDPAYEPGDNSDLGNGEYSYYKPKEAYELKKRIEREEQRLKEFYSNFDTTPAGARSMLPLAAAGGITGGITGGILGLGGLDPLGSLTAGALIGAGGLTTIASRLDAFFNDNDLAGKYARRNIVNTYVWTADGGFYEESTQISEVRSKSHSGSYSFTGKAIGNYQHKFTAVHTGLSGMMGSSINLIKSKSEKSSNSFSIDMKLSVPGNLQTYEYKDADNLKEVYVKSPEKQPGKVDAYRFMTFYLEPESDNFEDFFNKVVDPIWLEQSQHHNAIALRQAKADEAKKPKCWRIFHRVTFRSRILPDFSSPTASPLEKKMKELNISSNYGLIQQLDPFLRNHKGDFTELNKAVRSTVATYPPEFSSEKELSDIAILFADYYGVER